MLNYLNSSINFFKIFKKLLLDSKNPSKNFLIKQCAQKLMLNSENSSINFFQDIQKIVIGFKESI